MMGIMSRGLDRARAARYVEARQGELGLTRDQLADRANIDRKTVYNLLSGDRWPQAKTRGAIEKVLGWYPGDLVRIAEGGEPVSYEMPPTGRELLADAMRERRYELDLDWSDVARDAGLTVDELARLRRSHDPTRAQARGLDRAFRWEPGSVEALLNEGRQPVTIEEWRRNHRNVPYERLRVAIEERMEELDITLEDVSSAAAISRDQLDRIRFGETKPTAEEEAALVRALRWKPGSIEAIVAGGKPTPVRPPRDQARLHDHRSPREKQLDNFRRLAELAEERGDTELAARLLRITGDPIRAEMLEKFTRSIDPGDNSQAS